MKISQCYGSSHSTKLKQSKDPKGYVVAFKKGLEERFKKHKAKKREKKNNNSKKAGKQTIKAPKGYKMGRKTIWEQYDSVWETL